MGSTGRRSPQGLENGLRALRRQAGKEDRKSKKLEAANKELRARIQALEKKGGEGAQGGQGLTSRGESGMEEEWGMTWTLRRRSRAAKSWMSKKGSCRRSCEELKNSAESAEKVTRETEHSGRKKTYAKIKCCSTRGDAEDQRGS